MIAVETIGSPIGPFTVATRHETVLAAFFHKPGSEPEAWLARRYPGEPIERHVTGIFNKLGLDQSDADHHRRVLAVLRYLQG